MAGGTGESGTGESTWGLVVAKKLGFDGMVGPRRKIAWELEAEPLGEGMEADGVRVGDPLIDWEPKACLVELNDCVILLEDVLDGILLVLGLVLVLVVDLIELGDGVLLIVGE